MTDDPITTAQSIVKTIFDDKPADDLIRKLSTIDQTQLEVSLSVIVIDAKHDSFKPLPIDTEYNTFSTLLASYCDGKTQALTVIEWILSNVESSYFHISHHHFELLGYTIKQSPMWMTLLLCLGEDIEPEMSDRIKTLLAMLFKYGASFYDYVDVESQDSRNPSNRRDFASAILLELLDIEKYQTFLDPFIKSIASTLIKEKRVSELSLYESAFKLRLTDDAHKSEILEALSATDPGELDLIYALGKNNIDYVKKYLERSDLSKLQHNGFFFYMLLSCDEETWEILIEDHFDLIQASTRFHDLPTIPMFHLAQALTLDGASEIVTRCQAKVTVEEGHSTHPVDVDHIKQLTAYIITLLSSIVDGPETRLLITTDKRKQGVLSKIIPYRFVLHRIIRLVHIDYLNIFDVLVSDDSTVKRNMMPLADHAVSFSNHSYIYPLIKNPTFSTQVTAADLTLPSKPHVPYYILLLLSQCPENVFCAFISRDDFDPNYKIGNYSNMLHALFEYIIDTALLVNLIVILFDKHRDIIDIDEPHSSSNMTPLMLALQKTPEKKDDIIAESEAMVEYTALVLLMVENSKEIVNSDKSICPLTFALKNCHSEIIYAFVRQSISLFKQGNKSSLHYLLEHASSGTMASIKITLKDTLLGDDDISFVKKNKAISARRVFLPTPTKSKRKKRRAKKTAKQKIKSVVVNPKKEKLGEYIYQHALNGDEDTLYTLQTLLCNYPRDTIIQALDDKLTANCDENVFSDFNVDYTVGQALLHTFASGLTHLRDFLAWLMSNYDFTTHLVHTNQTFQGKTIVMAPMWFILANNINHPGFKRSKNLVQETILALFSHTSSLLDIVAFSQDESCVRSYRYEYAVHLLLNLWGDRRDENTKKFVLSPIINYLIEKTRYNEINIIRSQLTSKVAPHALESIDETLESEAIHDWQFSIACMTNDVEFFSRAHSNSNVDESDLTLYTAYFILHADDKALIALFRNIPGLVDSSLSVFKDIQISYTDLLLARHDNAVRRVKAYLTDTSDIYFGAVSDDKLNTILATVHLLVALLIRDTTCLNPLDSRDRVIAEYPTLKLRAPYRAIFTSCLKNLSKLFFIYNKALLNTSSEIPDACSLIRYAISNNLDAHVQDILCNRLANLLDNVDTADPSAPIQPLYISLLAVHIDSLTFAAVLNHKSFKSTLKTTRQPNFLHALLVFSPSLKVMSKRLTTLFNQYEGTLDVNAVCPKSGKSPLYLALELKQENFDDKIYHQSIIDSLLSNGAKLLNGRLNPLDWALQHDVSMSMQLYLEVVRLTLAGKLSSLEHVVNYVRDSGNIEALVCCLTHLNSHLQRKPKGLQAINSLILGNCSKPIVCFYIDLLDGASIALTKDDVLAALCNEDTQVHHHVLTRVTRPIEIDLPAMRIGLLGYLVTLNQTELATTLLDNESYQHCDLHLRQAIREEKEKRNPDEKFVKTLEDTSRRITDFRILKYAFPFIWGASSGQEVFEAEARAQEKKHRVFEM